jgi:hemolysin activation/secretion protein
LNLTNTLNRGEFLNLNWKSNPDKTQNLKFNFAYPYIFNTPIGVETDLNLHKQDTSFVKSLANFGINFQQPFYQVGIFNQIEKSSILTNNTTYQIRNFSKNTTGLKLMFRPQFTGKLSLYQPKISTKFGLFNYKSDSISSIANTTNLSYLVQLEQKINFFKYFSFTNTSGIQGMNSSYVLSRNELIYFGGLKSVRGFYELELVGNHLFTTLNEIEYQPLSILSFKLLYDYSSFENNGKFHSNSFGFGFGLLNKNSVLEIIIANGVINSSNVDFANTKIHIGFSSSF